MPASLDLTQDDVYTALRTFVQAVLGTGIEVVQGLANRVATPVGPNYVAITALLAVRLATNVNSFDAIEGTTAALAQQRYDVQVDVYGPLSSNYATMLTTLFRDAYACDLMPAGIQPLYADDPVQVPLVDGEQQYDQRWLITASVQYNPTTTTGVEFFEEIEITPVNVDVTYPPT